MRTILVLAALALASCHAIAPPTGPGQPPSTGCAPGELSLKCAAR